MLFQSRLGVMDSSAIILLQELKSVERVECCREPREMARVRSLLTELAEHKRSHDWNSNEYLARLCILPGKRIGSTEIELLRYDEILVPDSPQLYEAFGSTLPWLILEPELIRKLKPLLASMDAECVESHYLSARVTESNDYGQIIAEDKRYAQMLRGKASLVAR